MVGAGFWARYQLAGWREVGLADCVAISNRTRSKAEALAHEFAIPGVYDDPGRMLREVQPDFLDIVTDAATHAEYVELAVRAGTPVICQKPMAPDIQTAERLVRTAREAGVPCAIHENWRWQTPLREVAAALGAGAIGRPFRARVTFSCSFPVFDNQPFLRHVDRFILVDIGSHILDVARFLFGETETLWCRTARVNPTIAGEDVATVTMDMGRGIAVTCEMSYASITEHERFPQTYVFIEGADGSIELGPDYRLAITTRQGTRSRRVAPPRYAWADPAYDLVHASIVPCCRDMLNVISPDRAPETSAEDNIKTMRLVFASYDSARTGRAIAMSDWRGEPPTPGS
jgi:predicted dehydrogenase